MSDNEVKPSLHPDFATPLIVRAMEYAVDCHTTTNHRYDNQPYLIHLQMVYDFGCRFHSLLPADQVEAALAGCWVHDTIEDCRQTFNDVKKHCGETVAEIAYALTNEKGRNRKERANDKYYAGIRQAPGAAFVKLCDRLANVQYSLNKNSAMKEVYKKELDDFINHLWNEAFTPMFDELKALLS
jgi:(p)ppGpp synthase/HD superfamily hydrolase